MRRKRSMNFLWRGMSWTTERTVCKLCGWAKTEDQTEDEAVRNNKLMGVSLSGLRSTHQQAGDGAVRGQRARPLPAVRYLAIRHFAVLSFSSSLMVLYIHRNHKAYKGEGAGR